MKRFLPFILFAILAGFLYVGLFLDPKKVESPLIDKPAPAFNLPQLYDPSLRFTPEDMKGKVWLLNVFASWCAACRGEHPVLLELARRNIVPIVGMDYKDKPEAGKAWLVQHGGNPYSVVVDDAEGRIAIDYGVYGVPETYVIDKQGIIRYKEIGPVTPEALEKKILPLVAELQKK